LSKCKLSVSFIIRIEGVKVVKFLMQCNINKGVIKMLKLYYKGTEQGQWLLDGEYSDDSQGQLDAQRMAFELLLDGYIVSLDQE
jgi:hypothetical protein